MEANVAILSLHKCTNQKLSLTFHAIFKTIALFEEYLRALKKFKQLKFYRPSVNIPGHRCTIPNKGLKKGGDDAF